MSAAAETTSAEREAEAWRLHAAMVSSASQSLSLAGEGREGNDDSARGARLCLLALSPSNHVFLSSPRLFLERIRTRYPA